MTEAIRRTGRVDPGLDPDPAGATAWAPPAPPGERMRHPGWETPDSVPVALVLLDDVGTVVDYNSAAAALLGDAPSGLLRIGSQFMALIGPEVRQYIAWRRLEEATPLPIRLRAHSRLTRVQLTRSHSERSGTVIIAIEADHHAAESEARGMAFEESDLGMFVAQSSGRVITANRALLELADFDADSFIGQDWQQLLLGAVPVASLRDMRNALADAHHWRGRFETQLEHRGNCILEFDLRVRETAPGSELGGTTDGVIGRAIVGYVSDVTEGTTAERALREQARRDQLTGLLNRAGFLEALEAGFDEAQRSGSSLSLLFIDLDNFKSLNDHFGHRYGDILLKAFSQRLRSSLKSSDVIGRIGGDEFVVLFDPGLGPNILDRVVAKLTDRILDEYQLDDLQYTCTASFGSADYPWDAANADQLLEYADHAMYRAKTAGRNRYARFDRNEFRDWTDREDLLEQIERGIDDLQFVPYYQPVIDPITRRIVGAEALARWEQPAEDPDAPAEVRLPADFLPLIDGTPAGIRLGIRMVDQVVVHMHSFAAAVEPVQIALNLSAAQLRAEDIVNHVESLASRYGEEVARLRIELVESAFYDGDPIITDNLTRLRDVGASLSLDDFGTGHSSLLTLRAHEFTQLKIDRQFLTAATSGTREDRVVFETIIDMSRRLGLETVCEGVETEPQLEYVRELGAHLVQGFLFSPAVSKEEFRAMLAAQQRDGGISAARS